VTLPVPIAERIQRVKQRLATAGAGGGHTYTPIGGCEQLYTAHETEVLISGPAGTGKSRACLEKLHRAISKKPSSRALIVRKTRTSLTNSALVTYEEKVLENDPRVIGNVHRENRSVYRYPDGGEVVIGGLDKPTRIMSTEFDFIYVQEAIELDDRDWESLTSRLRNGVLPDQQLIGDTNPDHPHHWLKKRCESGTTRYIESHHEDNPTLFNQTLKTWTQKGLEYILRLDGLTGVRKERLRYGRWVQAEGVIYDNFDVRFNVTIHAEYNPEWAVIGGADDGYVHGDGPGYATYHPRVILLGQETPQGGFHIFYELYQTLALPEKTLDDLAREPYPPAERFYVDSSAAELKARIWEKGIPSVGATHPVNEGIKNLRRLIGPDENGQRLLYIHPRCINLIRELSAYVYDANARIANVGEPKPLKVDDHGPDCARYLCWHLRHAGMT